MTKQSLFKRYFSIYAATLLFSTLILGVTLMYLATQYFRNDKMQTLTMAAEKALDSTMLDLSKHNGQFVSRSDVEESYALIYNSTGVTVFFCNVDGKVEMCSEGDECVHSVYVMPEKILDRIMRSGYYADVGFMGGFYKTSGRYTYGIPVCLNNDVVGFIFSSTAITSLFTFLFQMIRMFLLAAAVMIIGSSIVIYYATQTLTRPLRDISNVAVGFGSGKLDMRVDVDTDDEIGRLARVFNRMADSLEETENTRRSFVMNVSHELRTPMTTIGGYIDGIRDGTIPPEEQGKYLEIVSDEVKRLSRLTTSLLAIARMDAGEQSANIEPCNVWEIILNVMLNAEKRISDKLIEVGEIDDTPCAVMCDRDMLHQVIYNIIDNAIKFTPEGGRLDVTVTQDKENARIAIRNSGAGIAPDEIDKIFERFYKVDKSRSYDRVGAGLGLYIVKTLISKMDGDIGVSSVQGEYTEFAITLKRPLVKSKDKKTAETPKKGFIGKLTRTLRRDERDKDDKR